MVMMVIVIVMEIVMAGSDNDSDYIDAWLALKSTAEIV